MADQIIPEYLYEFLAISDIGLKKLGLAPQARWDALEGGVQIFNERNGTYFDPKSMVTQYMNDPRTNG